MQKIILPISKCIPGMITAQPIVDLKTGTTILGQNQILTEEFLNNLPNFIYTDIWIYLDSFEKVWNIPNETIENYRKYSNVLSALLSTLNESSKTSSELYITDLNDLCKQLPIDFTQNYSLIGCTNLMEQLDYATYRHSLNVAFLSVLICRWCHLGEKFEEMAITAGLLHDIGTINLSAIPAERRLTADELSEYEKHPIYSYNITQKIKNLDPEIGKAILAHHENCNGTGFPLHLSSPYISKLAKVIALADGFDLLRSKHHIFETLRILLEDEITTYDPELLLTFCQNIANYYIGVFVTLSTGDIGEVVFINPRCVYKPIIKINNQYINLFDEKNITITNIE